MPIPKPKKDESKDKFISRCAKQLAKVDPNRPKKQRLAICFSEWKNKGR